MGFVCGRERTGHDRSAVVLERPLFLQRDDLVLQMHEWNVDLAKPGRRNGTPYDTVWEL